MNIDVNEWLYANELHGSKFFSNYSYTLGYEHARDGKVQQSYKEFVTYLCEVGVPSDTASFSEYMQGVEVYAKLSQAKADKFLWLKRIWHELKCIDWGKLVINYLIGLGAVMATLISADIGRAILKKLFGG